MLFLLHICEKILTLLLLLVECFVIRKKFTARASLVSWKCSYLFYSVELDFNRNAIFPFFRKKARDLYQGTVRNLIGRFVKFNLC